MLFGPTDLGELLYLINGFELQLFEGEGTELKLKKFYPFKNLKLDGGKQELELGWFYYFE